MKILNAIQTIFLGVFIIYFAIFLVGFAKYDDSDDVWASKRSGMTPKTDYKTGCQYLQSPFGFALVPRMASNGKQLGCKEQAK